MQSRTIEERTTYTATRADSRVTNRLNAAETMTRDTPVGGATTANQAHTIQDTVGERILHDL